MRAYRIVRELHAAVPYVIQGDCDQSCTWADIARFFRPDDARKYMVELQTRQRSLAEADTPLPLNTNPP